MFSTKVTTSVTCNNIGWLLPSSVWLQLRTLNLIISHTSQWEKLPTLTCMCCLEEKVIIPKSCVFYLRDYFCNMQQHWLVAPFICVASVTYFKLDNIPYISMGEIAYLNMYVLIKKERHHPKVMCFLLKSVLLCHATALVGCSLHLCGFSDAL